MSPDRLRFCCSFLVVAWMGVPALAARPAGQDLLPRDTVVYLRIANAPELVARFLETGYGRAGQDERLAPLLTQLYTTAVEAGMRREFQVELREIYQAVQGEIVLAVVPLRGEPPALVLMADVGDQLTTAQQALTRMGAALDERGYAAVQEQLAGSTAMIFEPEDEEGRDLVFCLRERALLFTTDVSLMEELLGRWSSGEAKGLRENKQFVAVMENIRAATDEQTHATLFLDPIGLARALTAGTPAQLGLAVLPALGLDGVQGLGGSLGVATKDYDYVLHLHLLVEQPRAGIPEVIALGSGSMKPQPWVPADVASYTTVHVDLATVYSKATALYDSFRGEGAAAKAVQARLSNPLGVNFEEVLLPALTGRFTHLTTVEQPVAVGSQATLVAMELRNADQFRGAFEVIGAKHGESLELMFHGQHSFYQTKIPAAQLEQQRKRPGGFQRPQPCFAILGNSLIMTDRPSLMERLLTAPVESEAAFTSALDYKLVASKARRLAGRSEPSWISFTRPEEGLRLFYAQMTDEAGRERLRRQGESNEFLKAVHEALQAYPLPPLEAMTPYLAPRGSVVYNDEAGLHYVLFGLRRK